MVFVPIGDINHSKRPSLSHSVSQIGVHLAIQLDSSMLNSYLVVVCCLGLLISVYELCNIAMTMVMLDYMCVQCFMITHITNNNL